MTSSLVKTADRQRNRRITARIEAWFAANARNLPWRIDRSGYTALVAELMLQQTQVARVLEKFEGFIDRFPDVQALAAADEQEVLTMWQGLGYYRRARNLHAAARMIVAHFASEVPTTPQQLQALPGIGRYSAGSIASIAFGHRSPIVDGNVARVLARLFGNAQSPSDTKTIAWQWDVATQLVEASREPGIFNEGLMELGALVCTPTNPRCADCPLSRFCAAKQSGKQHEIPPPKRPPTRQQVHYHAIIVRRGREILFQQRPATGLWANMWQVPTIEHTSRLSPARLQARSTVLTGTYTRLGGFQHETTHRRISFHVFEAMAGTREAGDEWRCPSDIDDLPMSNAQKRILREFVAWTDQSASDKLPHDKDSNESDCRSH